MRPELPQKAADSPVPSCLALSFVPFDPHFRYYHKRPGASYPAGRTIPIVSVPSSTFSTTCLQKEGREPTWLLHAMKKKQPNVHQDRMDSLPNFSSKLTPPRTGGGEPEYSSERVLHTERSAHRGLIRAELGRHISDNRPLIIDRHESIHVEAQPNATSLRSVQVEA